MSKVVGSYASVTRGVSEQVPSDRNPGQHYEQVNMVSDPVHGLSRRQGSVNMDEMALDGPGPVLTETQKAYARNYREYSFFISGTEYSILYMSDDRNSSDTLPFCHVLNKDTGKFLKVQYADKEAFAPWDFGGVSALTTVGQYVVMASGQLGPGYTSVDGYAALADHGVAWVRGGAYSRTFTLRWTRLSDGHAFTVSYTTLAASYPNLLDTSDIMLAGNSDYQKQVNDRVNAYNSATNSWIGQAAQSVQPQFIAAKLVAAAITAGFTTIGNVGGTVYMTNASAISCDDAGDGTLFRAVLATLDDPVKVSSVHYPNKVIQIKAPGAAEPYYLKFVPDDPSNGNWQTGTWIEAPAQTITPGQVFALGAVSPDGTTFVLASNAAAMNAATNLDAVGTPLWGFTAPEYSPSRAGDLAAVGAVPYFFGKRVTLLTVFMDRLVICANGTVFMSVVGDYFNFFRKSMLTVDDDDPIEVYALGAEDDIISKCVTYNKDLFMFGLRKQYTVSGRQVLTPATVAVSTTANERDSMLAQPVTIGNLIYYGKYSSVKNMAGPSPYTGQIDQFQLGLFQDTPETYRVSQQLTKYIQGRPIELTALSSPSTLFVRTDGLDNGLYVYSYIDSSGSQQRQFDSWSRWEWSANVGQIIGITAYKASLYVYTLRNDGTWDGARTYVACDQFVMDANVGTQPYTDAQRPWAGAPSGVFAQMDDPTRYLFTDSNVSIDATQPEFLLCADGADTRAFLEEYPAVPTANVWLGFEYPAYVTITPPFVRDRNDKAVVNGRLVINRYSVSVADTAGLDATITAVGATQRVFGFNGRVVGASNNQVGIQPTATTTLNVPCGRANSEHMMTFAARSCLPMTITSIEWVGQYFSNSRRV